MSELLIEERSNSLKLTINRPDKKNALSPELLAALADSLERNSRSKTTKVVILAGAGGEYFSSGYDISKIPSNLKVGEVRAATRGNLDKAARAIENYPFPVIAMLNGGACELAFACDFRYAAINARLCIPPAKLGLVYNVEGLQRMLGVVGLANLKKMIYTGGVWSAEKLSEIGAFDEVFSSDRLPIEVEELVNRIGNLAPISLKGHKAIFSFLGKRPLTEEEMRIAEEWTSKSLFSRDAEKAKKAFFEKKNPEFSGE